MKLVARSTLILMLLVVSDTARASIFDRNYVSRSEITYPKTESVEVRNYGAKALVEVYEEEYSDHKIIGEVAFGYKNYSLRQARKFARKIGAEIMLIMEKPSNIEGLPIYGAGVDLNYYHFVFLRKPLEKPDHAREDE